MITAQQMRDLMSKSSAIPKFVEKMITDNAELGYGDVEVLRLEDHHIKALKDNGFKVKKQYFDFYKYRIIWK